MGNVAIRWIILAKAGVGVQSPIVEIALGRAWKDAFARFAVKMKQRVFEFLRQLRLGIGADVRLDENAMKETHDQRCMIGV